jgi:uncharacterized membrane protein YkvA (DUF1232 family)
VENAVGNAVGIVVAGGLLASAGLACLTARSGAVTWGKYDAKAIAGWWRGWSHPRVPRRKKALLVALAGYLALPFDLVPDFIPVAGQLDDVVVVALVLRSLVRGGGEPIVREHWPGPENSLAIVLRLAG